MVKAAREFLRLRPGRDLLALFALTILLPGLVLAAFSGRALLQERNFANQQMRERLDRAADRTAREIERELREWQASLHRFDEGLTPGSNGFPEPIRGSLDDPGAAVVLISRGADTRVWPERQLLYPPASAVMSLPTVEDEALAGAESLELREKDYARAIVAYENVRRSASGSRRALAIHRLGRTHRKDGRHDASLQAFRELERVTERIAGIPADLIAKYEICTHWHLRNDSRALGHAALELYAGLVEGRWELERSRYLFYTETARAWADMASPAGTIARLRDLEEKKRALTEAAALVAEAQPSSDEPRGLTQHLMIRSVDRAGA